MKHYSLPRKREGLRGYSVGGNFTRAIPTRNSTGGPKLSSEPLVEYFVPRSVSEFNLSVLVSDPIPALPPSALRSSKDLTTRSKDKMVTFEDDQVALQAGQQIRKAVALEDVFM